MKKQKNKNDFRTSLHDASFNKRFDISTYISSLESIARSDTEETLGTVLSLVTSSHSPVFIFTKENEFFGLISPYQALYSHRYPYTTKVSSIAFKPQYITVKTSLYDIASYMLESRVYILPVFSEDRKLKGIIDIKEVLKNLVKDEDLLTYLSSKIKSHTPVTANSTDSVGEIYQIMHKKGVSRVVLLNKEGNLAGIVSRKDVLKAFMEPTDKQRFGKSGYQQTDRAFDVEKVYRKNIPVKNYSTEKVQSLPSNTNKEKIIQQLVLSQYNSIVLIDKFNKPAEFLSVHDILVGLASLQPEKKINLIMSNPSRNVSENNLKNAEEHLNKFGLKMNKRIAIEKIEVHFEEPKYPTGGTSCFNTSIIITPSAGTKIIAKTKSRSFMNSIQAATTQIENQQRRSGLTRNDSQHTR